ncbi:hypothetical protein KVR01_011829 [Diaporthe batatas]|uniref:uncharacterized protein n=1 Tax=Diaporthe batatas TaxID=748121 RepID=UPI001D03E959|nr:uncharacterized protein KVR01_011829 [Diaporthe batatas]KAG8158068.1 hypothetical protein KVR01_011829 [Diaporthe batatas]
MTLLSTAIPVEIFQEITSPLLRPDQAALARTCKALNRLLTPVVWGDVELHHYGTHEGIDIDGEAGSVEHGTWQSVEAYLAEAEDEEEWPFKKLIYEPSSRKYSQEFDPKLWSETIKKRRWHYCPPGVTSRATDNLNRRNFQYGREETFVRAMAIASKERWAELSQHVHSLCMSVGVDDEVVEVIASFRNLRSLELVGLPLARGHPAAAREVNLPHLQNLKLRGYFPAALARNICQNAEHITHLNLGLLATPTDDAAYQDTLLKDDDNRTLVTEEEAETFRQNGAEAKARSLVAEGGQSGSPQAHGEESEEDGEVSDDGEDEEDLPWALHSPIWLPRSLARAFLKLTHLHLVKPATGETGDWFCFDHFAHIPHRYEQILCMEWLFLLEAAASSLQELVLEHRMPQEAGDTVGDGDPWPQSREYGMPTGIRGPAADRGDRLFCKSVLRFMLEHSGRFSSLRYLALRGIQMSGLKTDEESDEIPGSNGVADNDEALRRAFPNCKVDIFGDTYPIFVYAGYIYQSWPENRHECNQDEGDGLLYEPCWYHDYKMRFGPQWRIES